MRLLVLHQSFPGQFGDLVQAWSRRPGWGESLYVKDAFPDARLVHCCEWYYQGEGADLGFDPEFPISVDDRARIRTWNALHALNLTHCEAAVTPTHWQKSRHPEILQPRITVQHDGIDTDNLGPDPNAAINTPSGTVLKAGDPVVTYVARNLEPFRGFHVFMRALEKLQQQHRSVNAVIVGGDDVSYGKRPQDAKKWREKMLREVKVDPTRTHFMGKLPKAQHIRVLQASAAHVYLTYPFVLSWSLLRAMAYGANVVASDTALLREVTRDGENGALVLFFDEAAYAPQWLQGTILLEGRAGCEVLDGDGGDDVMYSGECNDMLNGDSRRSGDEADDLLVVRGGDDLDGGASGCKERPATIAANDSAWRVRA